MSYASLQQGLGMQKSYSWKFILAVALPLLVASLAVVFLTVDLIDRVSTGANRADHERTRQIVVSAFGAAQHQLSNTSIDNAYWDDAVKYAYGDIDAEWINSTWGATTEVGINYSVAMVIDRDKLSPIAAYRDGKLFNPVIEDYFSGKIKTILDLLPNDNVTMQSKASIIDTQDGLAIVAAAPILPTTTEIKIPQAKPRYLIFLKFLTPTFLQEMSKQYVLTGLAINKVENAALDGEILRDQAGNAIVVVKWNDTRPGDFEHSTVLNKTILTLGFLGVVICLIAWQCWNLIQQVAEGEKTSRHLALHDALTGLPNRAGLYFEFGRLAATDNTSLAIAFADLDGFKNVNDAYGHKTGDQLIKAVAAGLKHLVGDSGQVCRLGGDEFVILFHGPDSKSQACLIASKLIQFLSISFDLDGRMAAVGASIGIASSINNKFSPAELMRQADVAMYKAKATGKNKFVQFTPHFDGERNEDANIANDLRSIVEAGSIDVAYQPIVDARTQKVVAVEALARWPSSAMRRYTPDKFIAVAETHGLIDQLGNAILEKACNDAKKWPEVRLSLNISPIQLRNPDFVQNTIKTISKCGMDYHRIEFEITEGTLVNDMATAKRMFEELQSYGIQIALDDFGTGFSSIGYLRQFGFDRIKIDRSLISKLLMSSSEQNIVQGTMLMANGLAATVTAEGVESNDQINILRLSGCDEMQGFFFYKPMPAAEIYDVLSAKPAPAALQA
jgi:diguanylate cyclase (GGDEF)-like protein